MVTDEERDYMYRMYAHVHQARLNLGIRRRLAPLLGNDRKRIELLNALLLLAARHAGALLRRRDRHGRQYLPGRPQRRAHPDAMELGQERRVSRAPTRRASICRSSSIPEYHYEAVNVEAQLRNPHSLLWWMRRVLALRKRWRALGEGKCEFLQPDKPQDPRLHSAARAGNASGGGQPVALSAAGRAGSLRFQRHDAHRIVRPHGIPGHHRPPVLPHSQPARVLLVFPDAEDPDRTRRNTIRRCAGAASCRQLGIILERDKTRLEALLSAWLQAQRWFGGKARQIKLVTIREAIPVPFDDRAAFLALILVDYLQGDPELYVLPLAFADGEQAKSVRDKSPNHILCDLACTATGESGVLYDALADREFCQTLLEMISGRKRVRTRNGATGRDPHGRVPSYSRTNGADRTGHGPGRAEQLLGHLWRSFHPETVPPDSSVGTNPDLEIGQFLTERQFPHMPRLGGALEHVTEGDERMSLAVLHEFIPNARDAWEYTLDALSRYYDRIMTLVAADQTVPAEQAPIFSVSRRADAKRDRRKSRDLPGVGACSGRTHRRAASRAGVRPGQPRISRPNHSLRITRRGLFQSMRNLTAHNLRLLRKQMPSLSPEVATLAQRVAEREAEIINRYRPIYERRITAYRIRCHGDFHLGQLLWTGKDFMILDFEGEPSLALSERRIKRLALRDVASMVRSFHYAAWAGFYQHVQRGGIEPENRAKFEPWVRLWYQSVGSAYLDAYLRSMGDSNVLPRSQEERQLMLPAYVLSKAVYEVGYELNHRPDWLRIPLQGILEILETDKK